MSWVRKYYNNFEKERDHSLLPKKSHCLRRWTWNLFWRWMDLGLSELDTTEQLNWTECKAWLPWWLSRKESAYNEGTQKTRVTSLGWEDRLEEDTTTHSSILSCRILWTEEEPSGLQFIGSQRDRHDWSIWAHTHTHNIRLEKHGGGGVVICVLGLNILTWT